MRTRGHDREDGSPPRHDGAEDSTAPPFLKKIYHMVDDESSNDIIRWTDGGKHFIIMDINEFVVKLLPRYFKHSNLSSFVRQLNSYGFRKVKKDASLYAFGNVHFTQGNVKNVHLIKRRKRADKGFDGADAGGAVEDASFETEARYQTIEKHVVEQLKNFRLQVANLVRRVSTVENVQEQVIGLLTRAGGSDGGGAGGSTLASGAYAAGSNETQEILQSLYAQLRESRSAAEASAIPVPAQQVAVPSIVYQATLTAEMLAGIQANAGVASAAHLEAIFQQASGAAQAAAQAMGVVQSPSNNRVGGMENDPEAYY